MLNSSSEKLSIQYLTNSEIFIGLNEKIHFGNHVSIINYLMRNYSVEHSNRLIVENYTH